jgi:hypothetical protein
MRAYLKVGVMLLAAAAMVLSGWSKWLFGCVRSLGVGFIVHLFCVFSRVGALCFPAKIWFCKTSESRFAKRGTLLRLKPSIPPNTILHASLVFIFERQEN